MASHLKLLPANIESTASTDAFPLASKPMLKASHLKLLPANIESTASTVAFPLAHTPCTLQPTTALPLIWTLAFPKATIPLLPHSLTFLFG